MLCNLLPRVAAKAVQAINGDEQKVTLTVKTFAVQMRFAECPVLVRKVDGDFTKMPLGGTTSASVGYTQEDAMVKSPPAWREWLTPRWKRMRNK